MSWFYQLYQTYENNLDRIGEIETKHNEQTYTLLPISHTTQNAHIEVNITEDGQFHSAFILDKINTIIPSTESSASRAGAAIAPYPLHDKLNYCAGDFEDFGGGKKEKDQFDAYIEQLEEWATSSYAHKKITSIFNYLKQRRLISDLIEEKILFLDSDGQLIVKWNKKYESQLGEKPELFTKVTGDISGAFVRFNVYSSTANIDRSWADRDVVVWHDKDVYQSFIEFYNNQLQDKQICYVTGEIKPRTDRHANKIRHAADKAKLISANDTSGFTYRGRFSSGDEAFSVSYDVSQKAHNALKWLINRQGKTIDNRVFLVWGNDKVDIFSPDEDSFSLVSSQEDPEIKADTNRIFAEEVSKAIDGYKNDLKSHSEVNILILDSATTGRLAVLYFRNMNKEIYLNNLKNWHQTCTWEHRYRKNKNKEFVIFDGAPATRDIAFAAYGPRASDKIVKGLIERMIPCVVDRRSIPNDIIRSAVARASNPVSMEYWEWQKTLSITCALINKKERIGVALDENNRDRNYLFGRLLAVAQIIEKWALQEQSQNRQTNAGRQTNAERYMVSFTNKPLRTWKTIHNQLKPYQSRLGAKAKKYNDLMVEITDMFAYEDFSDEPLNGKYLLGYSSQIIALDNRKNKNSEEN